MQQADQDSVAWRKSSFSSAAGQCVEVGIHGDGVAVRDTKAAGYGPVLVFTHEEWAAFLAGAKGGEFDLA
jgi:Domain of unknown function (DUF397)